VLARVADHEITELAALLPLELEPHNPRRPRWLSAAAPDFRSRHQPGRQDRISASRSITVIGSPAALNGWLRAYERESGEFRYAG
jgi:hypothetical protein